MEGCIRLSDSTFTTRLLSGPLGRPRVAGQAGGRLGGLLAALVRLKAVAARDARPCPTLAAKAERIAAGKAA